MPSRAEERRTLIQHMFRSLEMPSKTLTTWELDFIESTSDWFDNNGSLTEKQFAKLEGIYAEKTV